MIAGRTIPDAPIKLGEDFELDRRAYELRRAGRPLKLERIPMELLLLLVENQGQLISREQIIERIWGKGAFLDTDNSINAAVRKIRQVLKDDPDRPRFVQTVTGKGYRFIAPAVEVLPASANSKTQSQSGENNLVGKKVSHYRVLQLLGGGGMGVVYKAEDLKLGRPVALKFLPSELASDPVAFERLQREARAASALDHPNICSIYQLGEHEGQPFIVMQFLEGETLREWIERAGTKGPAEHVKSLTELAAQVAEGLEAAHRKGIIHRDIKPTNIFVNSSGRAKILDFGVAKFIDPPGLGDSQEGAAIEEPKLLSVNPHLTHTGVSVGTPSYLAPEQIRREQVDARTDLFSFGLVLYEMATGQRAFSGNTATAIHDAVLNLPVVPARQLNRDLPAWLERIIQKCLEKDPNLRYQSATELRKDLSNFGEQATREWWHRLRFVAAVAVLALIAGLFLLTNIGNFRQRLFRREVPAEPTAQIKLRRSVAVLGFRNLSGKDEKAWISTALSEMLGAELAAGQQLRIVPGENVARMKVDLSLPSADSFGQDTLTKIRNHLNTDMVVLGSYLALGEGPGGKVRLDVQLQDTNSGETVTVVSREGTETELAGLVSQSGAELRQKLGVGEVIAGEARQVQAAVPANPEAARLYSEGLVKLAIFDALAARHLLEKAIDIDPNHALSHSALAEALSQLGYKAQAQTEAKRAFDLSGGLSREDRLLIEGRYRERLHDYPAAIEIFRTLRNFFPDDLGHALRLATAQANADLGNDALQTIARMRTLPEPIRNDPSIDLAEADAQEDLSNFKLSREAAEAAAAKAQAQGSRLLVARAKVVAGWAWLQLGDPERAFTSYSEARKLWLQAGNARAAASALHGIAAVQRDRGDFLAARKAFEEAIDQFRKIGAVGDLASCVHNLGVLLTYQGHMREARLQYEEALRIQREIKDERGVASDLDDLGNVLESTGDLEGAARMKEQAVEIFHRLDNKFGEAIAVLNLGEVALVEGKLALAKERFDQALALMNESGDRRDRGYCLLGLGKILLAQDQLTEARKRMAESMALRQEIGDVVALAVSRLQLAKVALEQNQPQEAESLARAAAEALDRQRAVSEAAEAYAILALALAAEGKTANAEAAAEHALASSRQTDDVMARFAASLAAAWVQAIDGNVDAAATALEAVRGEAQGYGFAEYPFVARLRLAQLELKSGKLTAARSRLRELETDARNEGFLLIARKAASAVGN